MAVVSELCRSGVGDFPRLALLALARSQRSSLISFGSALMSDALGNSMSTILLNAACYPSEGPNRLREHN